MTALARWRVVRALVVALVCLAAAGSLGVGAVAQQATETADGTPNETVQHERPENAGEAGDTEQLQRWLQSRLDRQLGASSVALSEGEYERAKSMLGDDYDDRLAQYVEVAGETDEGGDAGETYREVRESQRDMANKTQRFEAAAERYQRARENGNETAAREAAREMNRLGAEISDVGTDTTRGYETLENQTGADTDAAQRAVRNVTQNVSERRTAVREATFTETTLTVTNATQSISATDPLALTGRVVDENDTAVANRTITVDVADRSHAVTTDGAGQFSLAYRPRTLALNASAVEVAYVPRNDSVFLGSNATVPVDVEQVQPTLRIRNRTGETGFGRPAGATAVVTVDGEPVDGVPVVVAVDGRRLARATTNQDGVARVAGTLPVAVAAGDRELEASLPLQNQALAPAAESAPVTVAETETNLTLTGDRRGDGTAVTGRLATADGRPVADQQVVLGRNGTTVTTVETDSNGSFAATVPLAPAGAEPNGRVQIAARFDGTGTNLEPSSATTTFVLGSSSSQGWLALLQNRLPLDGPWPVVVALALAVLAAGGLLAWRRRQQTADGDAGGDAVASDRPSTPAVEATGEPPAAIERAETFLERGAAGPAVRAAYAALRERYAGEATARTHAELLERAQSLDDLERTAVERVTSAYEREAFAPGSVDEASARAAIDAVVDLVDARQ